MIVLQVNMHRLTQSNFWYDVTLSRWRPWRHFTQSAHLVSKHKRICQCLCSRIHQFLIY